MSPILPTADVTCKVPSTKAWLLLLGLLSLLLLVAHQLPVRPVGVPPLLARHQAAHPASVPAPQPPLTTQRVALESPTRQPGLPTTFAPAATL